MMTYDTKPLVRARLKRGLARSAAAKAAGIDPATAKNIEEGNGYSESSVKKYADFLGVSMDDLLPEAEAV